MTALVFISVLSIVSPINDTLSQHLPDVTVTAMKESVALESVASAVSDISYSTLKRNGIYRPNSLSSIVPGLNIPDYGTSMTSTIYLRGMGSRSLDQKSVV